LLGAGGVARGGVGNGHGKQGSAEEKGEAQGPTSAGGNGRAGAAAKLRAGRIPPTANCETKKFRYLFSLGHRSWTRAPRAGNHASVKRGQRAPIAVWPWHREWERWNHDRLPPLRLSTEYTPQRQPSPGRHFCCWPRPTE
jgi:hypothetical protein